MLYLVGLLSGAQVEYKRVDLQSYEARNGASLAQSFKYKFNFPSMYRRLKSTRLIQCYERNQIWSETGSQMASEIPSKLTCVFAAPWSHRRLNWTTMLRVECSINVYVHARHVAPQPGEFSNIVKLQFCDTVIIYWITHYNKSGTGHYKYQIAVFETTDAEACSGLYGESATNWRARCRQVIAQSSPAPRHILLSWRKITLCRCTICIAYIYSIMYDE